MKELCINKKRSFVCSILFFCICLAFTCCCRKEKLCEGSVYKCFIFPTSSPQNNYLIEVFDSGMIRTSFGIKSDKILPVIFKDEKINPHKFVFLKSVQQKKEKHLTKIDIEKIREYASELRGFDCENFFVQSWANDTWAMILLIGDEQYIFLYSDHKKDCLGNMVNLLMKLSPLPVNMSKM